MTQPDVALTDYALALECLIFAYLLHPVQQGLRSAARWFMIFFLSIAIAAAVGGTVHGFYEDPASTGSRKLWPLTLIAIGITALAGTNIAATLQFEKHTAVRFARAAVAVFIVYCAVVLFVVDSFLIAIVNYLPVVLFLGWVFFERYRQTGDRAFRDGVIGVGMMLFAAITQQAELGIHPKYFNHNAVYHVIQAIALLLLFTTARHLKQKAEAI